VGTYPINPLEGGVRCPPEPRRFGGCFTTAEPKTDAAFPLPRIPKADIPVIDSSSEAVELPLDEESCEEVDKSRMVDEQETKLGRSGSFSYKYHDKCQARALMQYIPDTSCT
jgi:hypothetical protein